MSTREDESLQAVALQNAASILKARQRAEEQLLAAKEELKRSNERLSTILESIADGFTVFDRDWRISYLNARAEEIIRPLGKTREGVLGRCLWDEFPDLAGTEIEREYRRALAENVTVELETFYAPLGRWFQIRAYPSREGLSTYVQDITARKHAEEALRESNELLRATFEQAAVGIALAGPDGRFTRHNERFAQILGYSSAEVQQRTFRDITHPADMPETLRNVERLLAGEIPEYVMEKRYLRKDGTVVWSRTAVSLMRGATSEALQFIGVIQDITTQKEAEEALRRSDQFNRTVIESSRDCVKTLSLDGILLWISESGQRALCVGDMREVVGKSWIEFWSGEDREAARAAVTAAARGESGGFVGRFDVEGEPRWWDVVITPIRGADGRPERLLAVSRDVTERLESERERRELLESERAARQAAELASRTKDDFLATLSHELRTPLGAILGWTQLLRTGALGKEDVAKGLETIERNARAQTQLIEDLLDMSRITSGKLRLDIQSVAPVSFVEAAIETVKPAAEAKGVRIEKLLDPAAGPVSGDPQRLQQVAWNLLSNAVKFTPKDGKVQVVLERVNSHIELSVADTGIGFDPAFAPHLFERFRQADPSMTRQHSGLGLGLSIAKQLVEMHGGSIAARSGGPGKGATFTVRLPIAVVRRARDEERVHPRAGGDTLRFERSDLTGVVALVVDDEPDARDLMARLLGECGATVFTAGSGQEALRMLEGTPVDVLISDIGMPEMDGYELLRRVRRLEGGAGRKTPAIALTAFARSEDRTRALQAGYLVHVSKPVEAVELIATVASVTGRVL